MLQMCYPVRLHSVTGTCGLLYPVFIARAFSVDSSCCFHTCQQTETERVNYLQLGKLLLHGGSNLSGQTLSAFKMSWMIEFLSAPSILSTAMSRACARILSSGNSWRSSFFGTGMWVAT